MTHSAIEETNINSDELKTDESLISRILDGEVQAYEHIVRRYNDYMYKIGRSYGFSHSDTEDLMQEAYVNAYLNLAKFENRSTFKTWLTRIMLNECYHKKYRGRKSGEQTDHKLHPKKKSQMPDTNHNGDTEFKVDNDELSGFLEEAILNIPESYRMVLRSENSMA